MLRQHRVERLFALDEARIGLKVEHKRRWCPLRHRPPYLHQDRYRWLWLYVAVEPSTGSCVLLYLPHIDGLCLETFLATVRRQLEGRIGVVLDGSGSHVNRQVCWPDDLVPLRLPPYSPELNPAERWFQELRKHLANRVFDTLDQLEACLTEILRTYWNDPPLLKSITGYPWWIEALDTSRLS